MKELVRICDICNHSPCLSGCPNKTVVPTLYCDECSHGLYTYDKYIEYDGETIGRECYGKWTTEDWLDFLHINEKEI